VYIELSSYFKKEASEKFNDIIPENEMDVLVFHISELNDNNSPLEILKNDEIKYRGEMYDVYKTEYENDSVRYYCLNDKNENNLEKIFEKYVENKTQDKTKNSPIHNILVSIYKVAIIPSVNNNNYFQKSVKFVIHLVNLLPQHSNEIPTPPPKSFI
jgi:hypothetical protein